MVQDYPDYSLGAMVQTLLADNIIIDKLKVGAYTERRSYLRNDNGVTTPTPPPSYLTNTTYKGKFFPRGCRGMLDNLRIYCKRTGTGTLKLAYAPHPGMGKVGEVTITPGTDWDWKYAYVRKMWNYDSLFVWVSACDADVSYGYDDGTPYDAYRSANGGVTWPFESRRYFIFLGMVGETCGDVPVSGTINTVEIPSQSQERLYASNTNLPTTETTIKEIEGAGTLEYLHVMVAGKTDSHKTKTRIYCDGNLAFLWEPLALNTRGYTSSTPGISLLLYAVDGLCTYHVSIKFKFRRSLKITMQAVITGGQNVDVDGLVNLIR